MTSAVNPWDTESQPRVTHCPARHICLILFGRTATPLALFIDPAKGLPLSNSYAPPEAIAAPAQRYISGATGLRAAWLPHSDAGGFGPPRMDRLESIAAVQVGPPGDGTLALGIG